MELNIVELNASERGLTNSARREELLSETRKAATLLKIGKSVRAPVIVVFYGRKSATNRVYLKGYKASEATGADELQISSLTADLNRILRDRFPKGEIDGIPFNLTLDFEETDYEKSGETAGSAETKDRETLNVLPVEPKFSLEQMILSEDAESDLRDITTLVRAREKIYDDWGFGRVDPATRAIVNFYGPPGTGKTMAAHALAREFGMKILVLNYADIESKYVGDAPKNLMAAFQTATRHNAVLFFDEADSFLGKRISNVTQSADQAVNSLRSQMLMLLEEHRGIVVFATNLMENYDSAFKSRILKHARFELPDKRLRAALIDKMLPDSLPRKNEEFTEANIDALAEMSEGFSGREIKNAILNGMIISAKDKEYFSFADAKTGFEKTAKTLTCGKSELDSRAKKEAERTIRKKIGWKKGKKTVLSRRAKGYNLVKAED